MPTTFRFPSNRWSLDFLATLGARGDARNIEKLLSPRDLSRWFRDAGLLDDAPLEVTDDDLEKAKALREAIWRTANAREAGASVQTRDVSLINEMAASPTPGIVLSRDAKVARRSHDNTGAAAASCLAAIARDAIELLSGANWDRVRHCANPACKALFQDLSRPGLRRWCSMGDGGCGNRAKTASARSRKRA